MQQVFGKYFFLLMIALGLSTQCFAAQNLKMAYDQTQTSDNYYIQPGGVYIAPDGMFVLFDGELMQVNMLCADERGVFVPGTEMSRRFVRCSFCGRWYDPNNPKGHDCKGP